MTQAASELCVPWFLQLFRVFFPYSCKKVKKFRPLSYARRFSLYSPFPGGELLGRNSLMQCSSFIVDGSPFSPLWFFSGRKSNFGWLY
jgi:hypothetical protein